MNHELVTEEFGHKTFQTTLRICYLFFLIQLIGLVIFSHLQASHFNLEQDFAQFGQGIFKIAHGDFSAFIDFKGRNFYRDHGFFFIYLISPLWYIWPHPELLLWIQDVFILIAELVAFDWIKKIVFESKGTLCKFDSKLILLFSSILLSANPFVAWTAANDFHVEVFSTVFLILITRSLYLSSDFYLFWLFLLLTTGNVGISYAFGICLTILLIKRRISRELIFSSLITVFGSVLFSVIHADMGSSFAGYRYFSHNNLTPHSMFQVAKNMITQPFKVLKEVTSKSTSIWAMFSSAGLLGVFSPWVGGVVLVVFVESATSSGALTTPSYSFQNFVIFVFLPVGWCLSVKKLIIWNRRLGLYAISLTMCIAIGWTMIWLPETTHRWITTPETASSTLRQISSQIPASDELVVSQGVIGAFSMRSNLEMATLNDIPILTKHVYFVLTPNIGIELLSSAQTLAIVDNLVQRGARLLLANNGVYFLKFSARHHETSIHFDTSIQSIQMNTSFGNSNAANSQNLVYVLSGCYIPMEKHRAVSFRYSLSSNGPVMAELWDSTRNVLIARNELMSTNSKKELFTISGKVKNEKLNIFNGYIIWKSQIEFPKLSGDVVELRIWHYPNVFVKAGRASWTFR